MISLLIKSLCNILFYFFFFSSRRRHTRFDCDWSSDVCSSDLVSIPPDVALLTMTFGSFLFSLVSFLYCGVLLFLCLFFLGCCFFCCLLRYRSEERRVGKECRSRWLMYN